MNVFITGGSRGIGSSIVLKFVAEGWGVGFTYASNIASAEQTVNRAKEINPDANIKYYQLDLRDRKQIEKVAEQALNDFQNIHALVNNAALVRDNLAVMMSDEEWDEVIATDLTGPFLVIRAFLMHFISNRMGRIVNIGSLSQYGSSGQINYAAAKSGLMGLTLTLAKEYGQKNITSNMVTVGFVPTDMTKENLPTEREKFWLMHCPMKRVGKPEEIANTVYFLCSEQGEFINGEVIRVSGGLTYAP